MFYELLMELLMDYDSEESPYRTCISDLKHTITHASFIPIPLLEFHRYTDGLGEDPDAFVGILEHTVQISSHFGLARSIPKIGVRRVYLHWGH